MELQNIKAMVYYMGIIIEVTGVGIIVSGAFFGIVLYVQRFMRHGLGDYDDFRRRLGKSILLGLEFLVAGDIINTVSIKRSLDSVFTLGLIVLIRTFLSFSLGIELDRRLPWKGGDS